MKTSSQHCWKSWEMKTAGKPIMGHSGWSDWEWWWPIIYHGRRFNRVDIFLCYIILLSMRTFLHSYLDNVSGSLWLFYTLHLHSCQLIFILCLWNSLDLNGNFLDPLDDFSAPNYSKLVKSPMSFTVMREKILTHQYSSWRLFVVCWFYQSFILVSIFVIVKKGW